MWKNIIFFSGNCKRGLQVCIGKWKKPYEKVAWGEANLPIKPFQLIHGVEAILPIECEVPSLKIAVELFSDMAQLEERLVTLNISKSNVKMHI